jgi:membrane protease subunit HflK
LDDVLRNLSRRLSSLFGRSGGFSSGPTSNSFNRNFGSVVVLVIAIWIGSGVYRVDAQERAVVLRFGKYLQTTGPGYNWHLPWPMERKIIVNVSKQNSITDDATMLTADTNLVEVKSAVQYIQPDAVKLLFAVRDPRETLEQVSESAMREAIGQASLDHALAFDPSITEHAKVLLKETLDKYDLGIQILSVNLTDVNVPDAVQDAQRDAIKADKDRQRYQQDAEAYRNDVLPRARGKAAKDVARRDGALRPGAGAVRARARRDPRAYVPRNDGERIQERPQGIGRHQERQQHDVFAIGQAPVRLAAVGHVAERHDDRGAVPCP